MVEGLVKRGLTLMEQTSIKNYLPALRNVSAGSLEDVLNTNGCAYYQWLPQLIRLIEPKQVVELGGAMGASAIMMLQTLKGKLYSITLPEGGQEFSFIADEYSNLTKVLGNDLDLSNWPKDLDLSKTDLWFIDSEHTEDQVRKELDLYSPFFKPEAIVLFDDIHSFGLDPVWEDIKSGKWGRLDCYDATDPLHYSGYGVCRVL